MSTLPWGNEIIEADCVMIGRRLQPGAFPFEVHEVSDDIRQLLMTGLKVYLAVQQSLVVTEHAPDRGLELCDSYRLLVRAGTLDPSANVVQRRSGAVHCLVDPYFFSRSPQDPVPNCGDTDKSLCFTEVVANDLYCTHEDFALCSDFGEVDCALREFEGRIYRAEYCGGRVRCRTWSRGSGKVHSHSCRQAIGHGVDEKALVEQGCQGLFVCYCLAVTSDKAVGNNTGLKVKNLVVMRGTDLTRSRAARLRFSLVAHVNGTLAGGGGAIYACTCMQFPNVHKPTCDTTSSYPRTVR